MHLDNIKHGTKPKVLILGNGINRAYNGDSLGNLIEKMNDKYWDESTLKSISDMPFPLQVVIASQDNIQKCMDSFAESMKLLYPSDKQKELICELLKKQFDAVVTLNYTYELEHSISDGFSINSRKNIKYRGKTIDKQFRDVEQNLYQFYSFTEFPQTSIWHAHGECLKSKSMVIGHYYYGKLLSKVQSYASSFIPKYKGCKRYKKDIKVKSWIDYFLLGDVYILGCGLDFSEMDFWWLINYKKRHFGENGRIYFYEPNISKEKELLAESYGVIIKSENVSQDGYEDYYNRVVREIGMNYDNGE